MVRPCAKYARLNCEHRQKNTDGKTPSDIFYVGLLTCARRGLIWGLVRRRAGEEQFDHRLAHLSVARSFLAWYNNRQARSSLIIGLSAYAQRSLFLGLVLCCDKYKRAVIARFLSVAEGNISRLRDAQAFHAAVKRPPYFTFARQRRHFTTNARLCG